MRRDNYDIFISYRRLDEQGNISGRDQARLIAKQLEIEGYRPFFDYSEIKDDEFDKVIIPAVENCKVFILVLTKDALCRCKNEDDWVRREIETAIKSGSKVINVSPDNMFNGWPDTLPKSLSVIRNIQISEIHFGSLFELSIKKLISERIVTGIEGNLLPANKGKFYFAKIVKYAEWLLLFISTAIFVSFAILDIGYDSHTCFVPYYEWFLGAYTIYLLLSLIGYARPSLLLCESRKCVTIFFFVPFLLLAIVGGCVMEEYENDIKSQFAESSLGPNNNFLDIELNKEMFFMFYGKPQTITQLSSNMPQPMIVEFDQSGRVKSKKFGNVENIYIWNTQENTIECKGYNNGKYIGSVMIYIQTMSHNRYMYEANGAKYEIMFRSNGSISKSRIRVNGQSMNTTYLYKSAEDKYPYKLEVTGGGQTIISNFSGIDVDSIGNIIRVVQTSLGQSSINTTNIKYYN